jgi:hypothetical protein
MTKLGPTNTIIIGAASIERVTDTLTGAGIEGAFVYAGMGLWKGDQELAVAVKVDGLDFDHAEQLSVILRNTFNQDSVLLEHGGEAYLV